MFGLLSDESNYNIGGYQTTIIRRIGASGGGSMFACKTYSIYTLPEGFSGKRLQVRAYTDMGAGVMCKTNNVEEHTSTILDGFDIIYDNKEYHCYNNGSSSFIATYITLTDETSILIRGYKDLSYANYSLHLRNNTNAQYYFLIVD